MLRVAASIVPSSADPLYSLSALYDNASDAFWKFGTFAGGENALIDGDQLVYGNFENWSGGAPVGWVVAGTVAQDTVVKAGAFSAKISGTTGSVSRILTLTSGRHYVLDGWVEGDGALGKYHAYLQNLATKSWWNGAAWQAAKVEVVAPATTASYQNVLQTLQLEGFQACGGDLVNVQLTVACLEAGFCRADEFYVYPTIDYCGIHGHSIDSGVAPTIASAPNNPGGSLTFTTQATMGVLQPVFYSVLGARVANRWWKFTLPVANQAEAGLAELVLGETYTLGRPQDFDWSVSPMFDQVEAVNRQGKRFEFPLSDYPHRAIGLNFLYPTLANYAEARDEIVARSLGVANPLIVIPDDSDPVMAALCRQTAKWNVKRHLGNVWNASALTFEEQPFLGQAR
jgi:hypothetical protein